MKKHLFFLPASLALVLLLTACAGPQAATSVPTSAPPTSVPPTSAPATEAPAAATSPAGVPVTGGPALVNMASSADFGPILVDDKGMSLYLFTKDTTPNTSSCYNKCATSWPPLLTSGAPVAGDGVDASKLGTTQRTDGTTQVTYNGWPLYYYAKDTKAGDMNGQNVGEVWFLISPSGDQAQQSAAPTQAAPPTVKPPAY